MLDEVLKLADELGDKVEDINSSFKIMRLLSDEIFEDILICSKPDIEMYQKRFETYLIKAIAIQEYSEKIAELLKKACEQAETIGIINLKKELKPCQN